MAGINTSIKDLEKAVDLLMEIAADAVFPEKELEKGVVLDEISACRDTRRRTRFLTASKKSFSVPIRSPG